MLDVSMSSMFAKVPNTLALARPLANGGLGETSSGAMSHHNHRKLPEEKRWLLAGRKRGHPSRKGLPSEPYRACWYIPGAITNSG